MTVEGRYTNIFDTHAHYTDPAFDADRDDLLAALPEAGVRYVMLAGGDDADGEANPRLAARYDWMYAASGIHPTRLRHAAPGWFDRLAQRFERYPKLIALGETGLDYHRNRKDIEEQKDCFRRQLELARDLDLPVILHIREALGDAIEILRHYRPRGVAHCFSWAPEVARELTDMGLYLGIGGALTFENARKVVDSMKVLPLDRMVLETDCPYLAPVPHRGERCDSRMIAVTAERAAAIRGIDTQQLIDQCCENAKVLYGIA